MAENGDDQESVRPLGAQGQTWRRLKITKFEKPIPMFDQPLEITRQMLRGLRMVDETVLVHAPTKKSK